MSPRESLLDRLRDDARASHELHLRSRRILVNAARAGAAAGLTQRQISEVIGRSQPEVSRLLRFHGYTALGRALERNRAAILKTASAAGVKNVRVFGSVSRGDDTPDSDIDLLVDLSNDTSLLTVSRLERELSKIVGAKVDIVPAGSLRKNLSDRVLAEAVPL